MKKYLILPILATAIFANASTDRESLISEYKNMFQKIGEKRFGVDERHIDALKAPFVKVVTKTKTKTNATVTKKAEPTFELQAILNKSAKISGEWYTLNSKVHGMKIISVRDNYVWLKNDEFRKKLTLGNNNEKISIK